MTNLYEINITCGGNSSIDPNAIVSHICNKLNEIGVDTIRGSWEYLDALEPVNIKSSESEATENPTKKVETEKENSAKFSEEEKALFDELSKSPLSVLLADLLCTDLK